MSYEREYGLSDAQREAFKNLFTEIGADKETFEKLNDIINYDIFEKLTELLMEIDVDVGDEDWDMFYEIMMNMA